MRLIIGFLDENFYIFKTPHPLRLASGRRAGPREMGEGKRGMALIFEKRKTEIWGIIGWDLG